jgi:RND family efflux transporter MFP subunit
MRKLLLFFLYVSCLYSTEITGIVKPINEVKLSVSTDGLVSSIVSKDGAYVKKGQIVLKLDDKLQKLQTLRQKIVYEDKTKLNSLRKSVKILKEIVKKKEMLYNETKSISLNELNQMKMQLINIEGELASMVENEKKEKIEYQISDEVLKYYSIRSPIDGVVVQVKPKIGEWIQTGNEVAIIVDATKCYVEANTDIMTLKNLKIGENIQVVASDGNSTVQKVAVIDFISATADSSSGLVKVKAIFDNSDFKVTPGITAKLVF